MKIPFYTIPLILWLTTSSVMGQGLFSQIFEKKEINNIRASLLPDKKSVYLLWEPSLDEGDVIIARSKSIIDTPEKLYVADSLGRFPVKGKNTTSNFYDYNLKQGSYYYAIVTVDSVKKRNVKLVSNQNFTTKPIIVEEFTAVESASPLVVPSEKFNKTKSIGNIQITAEGTHIRISWVPPWNAVANQSVYSIYRSNYPMDTMEDMKKADKLTEIAHPINTYLDMDIEKSQTLYYGVSIKEEDQPEILPLEKNKSFKRIFFIYDKKGQAEVVKDNSPIQKPDSESKNQISSSADVDQPANSPFTVRGFGYDRSGKGATLKWNPPIAADDTTQYTIYASMKSFDSGVNSFIGGSVIKVGILSHPTTSIVIKEIKPVENLYFAVTAKKADTPEEFNLLEGNSYFKYEFDKDLTPEIPKEESSLVNNNSNSIPENSKTDPSDTPELNSNQEEGENDSERILDNSKYIDINGKYKVQSSEDELKEILLTTYAKNKHSLSVYKLTKYAKNEDDFFLKGKALFYLGISYYKLGEYRKSLKLFNREETREYDPDRSSFWKNRSLDMISRGRK
jgi:hypothetical protein